MNHKINTSTSNNLKLKFVSTGSFFDYKIGNSSAILEHKQGNILIDCGYTVYATLCEKKLIERIDYLLLTHLHGDHMGSIHPLIIHLKHKARQKRKLKILYPNESFRKEIDRFLTFFLINPDDSIEYVPLSNIEGAGYIDTKDKHVIGLQTFAYSFESENKLIYYSGDLGDINITLNFLKNIQKKEIEVFHEIFFQEMPYHVYYKEVMKKLSHYNIFGYHCDHTQAPADNTIPLVANHPEYLL